MYSVRSKLVFPFERCPFYLFYQYINQESPIGGTAYSCWKPTVPVPKQNTCRKCGVNMDKQGHPM